MEVDLGPLGENLIGERWARALPSADAQPHGHAKRRFLSRPRPRKGNDSTKILRHNTSRPSIRSISTNRSRQGNRSGWLEGLEGDTWHLQHQQEVRFDDSQEQNPQYILNENIINEKQEDIVLPDAEVLERNELLQHQRDLDSFQQIGNEEPPPHQQFCHQVSRPPNIIFGKAINHRLEGSALVKPVDIIKKWLKRLNYSCKPYLKKSRLYGIFNSQLQLLQYTKDLSTVQKLDVLEERIFEAILLEKLLHGNSQTDIIQQVLTLSRRQLKESNHILSTIYQTSISKVDTLTAQPHSTPSRKAVSAKSALTKCRSYAFEHTILDLSQQQHPTTSCPRLNMAALDNKLGRFLGMINECINSENGIAMRGLLVIEPPYHEDYMLMLEEVRSRYSNEQKLENFTQAALPDSTASPANGGPWSAFVSFIVQYIGFIQAVKMDNLLETYNLLTELLKKANSCLNHPTFGVILVQTVVAYAKVLARLAVGLDKRPDLIAHVVKQVTDEGGQRLTLPERAADILRQSVINCLSDQKRQIAVYQIANLYLKILFQCGKSQSAGQIFGLISQAPRSSPLSAYPRAERVTYLYYLGRFKFQTSHFYHAMLALQAAYAECHIECLKQRRLILIFLIASNIILGRFPRPVLYSRPEASGLQARFEPLCKAIGKGDLSNFRRLTSLDSPNADWFLSLGIFLQLRNRCEALVWRSLTRRTFLLNGTQGDASARKAPTLDLADLHAVAHALELRALHPLGAASDDLPGRRHTNWILVDTAAATAPPASAAYVDADFDGLKPDENAPEVLLPELAEVECTVASLVEQGLMNGFVSHRLKRFAVQGARSKPAVQAGWPAVWETVRARASEDVVGWRKDDGFGGGQGYGPGMVVKLSGVRPIGGGGN